MAENRAERRLAAILAADVAGYSRLMGADEEGTLSRLKAHQGELLDPKIAEHRGRIVKTTGDGILVEFGSVVDAVRCAVEIQRGMVGRNAAIRQEERVTFRIGINVGDVISDGGDLFGDGVNIAARLEALADPGGICVSGRVQEDTSGKLDIAFEDQGEQQLKNIARPVRVYRVRLSNIPLTAAPTLALPDKPSIAVLPFQNMSGDPEQEYFGDGVVEDIITALSRFSWLFVIARNSSFTYKGKAVDVKQVGRELGVRYVLEGSVRKAGNRVRVTGQLIDALTGAHLWAERYDRSLDDIFALQDEIVVAIIGALVPEIGGAEIERSQRAPPQNLNAWDRFQRGLYCYYRMGKEDLAEAQKLFDQAVELDRAFPDPYVFRALTGIVGVFSGYATSPSEVLKEADGFAQRALQLDQGNALAHTIFGRLLTFAGKHEAAIAENRLSIELNPNLALAHYGLGAALLWSGHADRSIPHLEQALRLSPRDPLSPVWRNAMSMALTFMGDDAGALVARDEALRQLHNVMFAALRPVSLVGLGRFDEARASVAESLAQNPRLSLRFIAQSMPGLYSVYLTLLLDRLREAGLPE